MHLEYNNKGGIKLNLEDIAINYSRKILQNKFEERLYNFDFSLCVVYLLLIINFIFCWCRLDSL